MTDRKDQLGCCFPMIDAQQAGTDNEAYGSLVSYSLEGIAEMGCDLPPITFCPWCGKKIKRKRHTKKGQSDD